MIAVTKQNWKTSLFGGLAALGLWCAQSGTLEGTKWKQPVAIVTTIFLGLAAASAKDAHADDYVKTTETTATTEKTTETEKI